MWNKYAVVSSMAMWTMGAFIYAQVDPNTQYLVYLTSDDPLVIQQSKIVAPDAFSGTLDSGRRVLQMGRYNNLNLAQRRVEQLKAAGIPTDIARVSAKLSAPVPPIGTEPFPGASALGTPPPAVAPFPPVPSTGEITPLPGVPGSSEFSNPQTSIEISRPPSTGPAPIVTPPPLAASAPTAPIPPSPVAVQEKQSFERRNRYFVIIPSTSEEVLAKVKNLSPAARFSATERGSFIEVQGYPDRPSAEILNKTLREQGLDSRVIYL